MKPLLAALSIFALGAAPSLLARDMMTPSQTPPAGLAVEEVPQFVMLGFDDNPDLEPMQWITGFMAERRNAAGTGQAATFDGEPARAAFFSNGRYLDPSRLLSVVHREAWQAGHEVGNHTYSHDHGAEFSAEQWEAEITRNTKALLKAQIPRGEQRGFRTPFLEYNPALFVALEELHFVYDSSIEEGYQSDQDGTNFLWPYTLDHGSPGNAQSAANKNEDPVGSHPGLWEIPLHVFIVPDDETCERYGVPAGMRERAQVGTKLSMDWDWDVEVGKLTGLDWNVFEQAQLDGADFLAILKYNLDLRLAGNRAPFMIGGHTQLFPESKPGRREAMEQFIDYALSKPQVRLVTPHRVLEWLRNPVALGD